MEPTDSFSLRWDDFEANTRVALKELREEREFCDVTLATDGKQVSAHKVILAGGSKFFQQILKQNPHPHPLIYLKGVRYEYLLSVLDFVYTGEANVNEKELVSFLDVADDLQIKGLIEKNPSIKHSTKEGEAIPSTVSQQDESSDVNKEAGPLLHAETPSHGDNPGYQSNCEEVPIDTPFDVNVKVEKDDQIHSASFGMEVSRAGLNDMKDVTYFKTEIHNSYEIGSISKEGQITADVCEQFEDVSDDALTPNSGKLAPVFTLPNQQKSDLPLHQLEFSAPYFNSGFVKSNCEENHDGNQVLVDNDVKTKPFDTSSFHFNVDEGRYVERDDFLRGFDDRDQVFSECDMTERDAFDSDSNRENERNAHCWYEEGRNVSVRHDGEQGENYNEELSTVKNGRKVCSVCGKSVRKPSALKEHMRTHTGEKPFSCSFCDKTFSHNNHLKVHTRIHTGEKPFPCLYCPKTFRESSKLQKHTRIHTGEKPFQCLVCFKRFTQSSGLNIHKKQKQCSMKLGE